MGSRWLVEAVSFAVGGISVDEARTLLLCELEGASSLQNEARWKTVRELVATQPDPFDRNASSSHATVQAIVFAIRHSDERSGIDRCRGGTEHLITEHHIRVLLHHHKRWPLWLCPGGHIDGGELASEAAVRETLEEAGVVAKHPLKGPTVVDVDIHNIPDGHVHYDVRYLMTADDDTLCPQAGESDRIEWVSVAEAMHRADESLRRTLQLAVAALDLS